MLRLHGAPGGPTSITGTARLALAIFYIVITQLSGHTQVEVARAGRHHPPWNSPLRWPAKATLRLLSAGTYRPRTPNLDFGSSTDSCGRAIFYRDYGEKFDARKGL